MAAVASHDPEAIAERAGLEERTVKAATEYLTVHGTGIARDTPGLYKVTSQSGSEYTVDLYQGACDCPDHEYRDVRCKHIRRAEMAVGERPIPDIEGVDPQLGTHVDGDPWRVGE